jgi:hypothetical protein
MITKVFIFNCICLLGEAILVQIIIIIIIIIRGATALTSLGRLLGEAILVQKKRLYFSHSYGELGSCIVNTQSGAIFAIKSFFAKYI